MHSSILRIITICFVSLFLCGTMHAGSKPLSEKDRQKLADIARRQYEQTMMYGASMYKFKGRNILLVIVDVKKSTNAQRVGQVKASRLAGEFLQDATNKSITVYDVREGNAYSFQDEGSERSTTSGILSSGNISQSTEDFTTTATHETFSDRIIQSSITRVGHIEPLCRIGTEDNDITFAYFMIVER